jgi:hypothetical protein
MFDGEKRDKKINSAGGEKRAKRARQFSKAQSVVTARNPSGMQTNEAYCRTYVACTMSYCTVDRHGSLICQAHAGV